MDHLGPGLLRVMDRGDERPFWAHVSPVLGFAPGDLCQSLWSRHRQPVLGVMDGQPLGKDHERLPHALSEALAKEAQLDRWPAEIPLRISVRQVESAFSLSGGQLVRLLREHVPGGDPSPGLGGHTGRWHLMVTLVGDRIFWGYGCGAGLLTNPLGGLFHYRQEDLRYSRAASKLLEAFEVFGLPEHQRPLKTKLSPFGPGAALSSSARKIALDLGAAPGGWTGVLLQKGFDLVYGVDPAALDPQLAEDPRVVHLRQKAEDIRMAPESLDMIVCDANWRAQDTLKTMAFLSQALKPGGQAILTLKLMGPYQKAEKDPAARQAVWGDLRRFVAIIKQKYHIVALRQLFHNRHELTAFLKKP